MRTLLIVYHSMTGGTRQMAEAAARGAASEPGLRVRLLAAPDAQPADVLAADGYLFATPENLAAIAGLMKDFSTAPTTRRWGASKADPTRRWCAPAATAATPLGSSSGSAPAGGCGRWPSRS